MNINFVLPIAGYSGFSVDDIVTAFLSGSSKDDVFSAFQNIKGENKGRNDFFYDYIRGLCVRYPELLESINALRKDNGVSEI